MKIKVDFNNQKYIIDVTTQGSCFTLCEDGSTKVMGYYSSINGALLKIVKTQTFEPKEGYSKEALELIDVVKTFKSLSTKILNMKITPSEIVESDVTESKAPDKETFDDDF